MLSAIVYILGIVAGVWCVLDIFKKKHLSAIVKLILAVVVILTSWIGFIVYYLLRNKI